MSTYCAYIGLALAISMLDFLFRENYGLMMLWSIASIFLSLPLALGILHVNNMVYYKRPCSANNLFDFFRNYHVTIKVIGVSVIYYLMLMAVLFPVMMLTLFPIIFSSIAGTLGGGYGIVSSGMIFLLVLMVAITLFISFIFSSFCSATYFIALRNRSITFGKLLASSMKVGWKYLWNYTVFQLSFFGWLLLCLVPAMLFAVIAVVVAETTPYMLAASTVVLIAGFIIAFLGVSLVSIYINAATSVFFNTAIDEYEQTHPNYTGFTPLHVPQQGGYRPSGPSAQTPAPSLPSFPDAAPPQAPASDIPPSPGPAAGEDAPPASRSVQPPSSRTPSQEPPADAGNRTDPAPDATLPPRIEAEPVAPSQDACEVVLLDAGLGRILVAQRIADFTGVSIEAAREMANQTPHTVARDLTRSNAHELARALTDLGAQVEIR